MNKIVIYKVTNLVNQKIYIGQTKNLKTRMSSRRYSAVNFFKNCYFDSAIRKHGWENFVWTVIETVPDYEADHREMFWIQQYKSNNRDFGYNLAIGGRVNRGFKKTPEQCNHHSLVMREKYKDGLTVHPNKGKRFSPERKKQMSENMTRLYESGQLDTNKISLTLKAKYASGEIINPMLGKKNSPESIKKCKQTKQDRKNRGTVYKTTAKPVICIDTGIIYHSARHAEKETGISYKLISNAATGYRKLAKGYQWKFYLLETAN